MVQITTSRFRRKPPILEVSAEWISDDPHGLIRSHMAALCTITSQGRMTGYWVRGLFDGPHWKANLLGYRFIKENPDGTQGENYDLPLAFERSCECGYWLAWGKECKHVRACALLGLTA